MKFCWHKWSEWKYLKTFTHYREWNNLNCTPVIIFPLDSPFKSYERVCKKCGTVRSKSEYL